MDEFGSRRLREGRRAARLFALVCCACLLVGAASDAVEIQVFAAASLTDALEELAPAYERETGDVLRFNFAGSNVLERQIDAGAPADVFLSADEARMDALEKSGTLLSDSRSVLLSNALTVVVHRESEANIGSARDLVSDNVKRLALADPRAVPAGIYAKAFLEKYGVWAAVADRVVPAENVRGALAAVESGNADAAIVYRTDAGISQGVKVAFEIPARDGPAISYPVAVMKESRHPREALRYLEYLKSEPARAVFVRFGFLIGGRETGEARQ